jgi:GNAT superfamily N-acetyltransferase
VKVLPPDALGQAWDAGLSRFEYAALFSRWVYLKHLRPIQVVAAFNGDEIVAAFPVPIISANGISTIGRSRYLSPYFPILFRRDNGPHVAREQRRRAALAALIGHIQRIHASVVLPLHPDLTDMVPLKRAHFQLELRTTYELPLNSLTALWQGFAPSVRNHLRKADILAIDEDRDLTLFDFAAAAFYEDTCSREQWRSLAKDLIAAGHATALIARFEQRPVGGLFLAYDHYTAYNLLSYFDRSAPVRGTPSALIWAAAKVAAALGLARLDLEGSVLANIEAFYQQFGGIRRPYYQIHWYADESRQIPMLYRYEEEEDEACD